MSNTLSIQNVGRVMGFLGFLVFADFPRPGTTCSSRSSCPSETSSELDEIEDRTNPLLETGPLASGADRGILCYEDSAMRVRESVSS